MISSEGHYFRILIIMHKQPPEVLCKKGVRKNLAEFTEKNLCWSLCLKRDFNTVVFF